ncbi:MAG: phage tail protein [Clostridiales bacterium]|nr:phage tail protein [Clostridiales bacterium]
MAGIFNEAVLTQKGIALLAKAQAASGTITLTRAVTGAGEHSSSEDLSSCTALTDQRQEFALSNVKVQNSTNVYVKFVMSNATDMDGNSLSTGYYVKEVDLYAKGSDGTEVLYAIATAVTDQWDYMPSYNDLLPSTITVEFLIEVANAEEVTIESPNSMYLYDDTTGDKYVLGVDNGLLYYEEVEE